VHLDAKRFSSGTTLDTDVCIVGAGPAGLVLAAELAGGRHDVILLESGGDQPEPDLQALNDGDLIGDEYASLGASRHRQVGGTSHLWNTPVAGMAGAKYVPLDAADFERRGGRGLAGWPFGLTDLRGDYERAQRMCGLGPFAYDAAAWAEPKCEPWADAGALVSRVYQVGTREALVAPLRRVISAAANVRLCSHATAVALDRDTQGRRVNRVSIATLGGAPWSVRAALVVLAAGAVENARLLLLTDDGADGADGAGCAGNASGWVGRGFMEHPRDSGIVLRPRTPGLYAESGFYDLHRAADGTWITGRLGLGDAALRDADMPNASATLLARPRPAFDRLRAVLPAAGRRLTPGGGHGWSRRTHTARLFDGFTVLLNVEQAPHQENRVTLGTRRDALGVPLPVLEWRWRADDQGRLERLRALVVDALGAIGRVTVDAARRPDPNAHHHAGTTRLHDDPALGVCDRNARVHGMDNLYVAGASLFPTAGFANPTLTIVALTLRLARHLLAEG
jgi:choline dehydrogenase-like flavoprotein